MNLPMSHRMQIAMEAMGGLLASGANERVGKEQLINLAYEYADAMIAAEAHKPYSEPTAYERPSQFADSLLKHRP